MILTAKEIKSLIDPPVQMVTGIKNLKVQLQPVGLDLTLKKIMIVPTHEYGDVAFHTKQLPKKLHLTHKQMVPGRPYILICNETFNIPNFITVKVYPRSTLTRMGCMFTSALADPGYRGQLHFVMIPGCRVQLLPDARFAQAIFMKHARTFPYNGHYQGGKE